MLVRDIEHYLRKTRMPPSRFGMEAVRDPRLVFDLRKGRQVGPRIENRVRAYMAARP